MNESCLIAFTELDRIIDLMYVEDSQRIPIKFRTFLKENSKPELGNTFNTKLPLWEQKMTHRTKLLLAFVYEKFLI